MLYDRYEHLGAVEFYQGIVLFEGNDILRSSFKYLQELFRRIDPQLEIGMCIKSYKYGIGICGDEEDDAITSVIVFKKDYYN